MRRAVKKVETLVMVLILMLVLACIPNIEM